jgi:hypothetical protein
MMRNPSKAKPLHVYLDCAFTLFNEFAITYQKDILYSSHLN